MRQCRAAFTLSQQQTVLQAQQLTSVAIAAKEDLHVTRRELDEAVSGAEAAAIIRCPLCLQLPHMSSHAWLGRPLLPPIWQHLMQTYSMQSLAFFWSNCKVQLRLKGLPAQWV